MGARRLIALLCGVVLLAAAAPAADPAPAGDLPKGHLDGYIAMVNADRARDRGQYKSALQSYREARMLYQKVGRENPEWHPEVVQYRLTYCQNQIDALLKQSGKSEAELLAEPEAAAEGDLARTRAKYADLMKEHAEAQAKLTEVQSTLQRVQGEVLARDGEIARLREDINRARDQLLASTNTMAAANQLAQNVVASLEEEVRRLKRDLQAQTDAGKLAAQEYLRLQTEMEGVVLADAKVREELTAVRTQLEQGTRQSKDAVADLATLRKDVAELRARDGDHAGELKKRDEQLAKLRAENQRLADQRLDAESSAGQREKAAAQAAADLQQARTDLANARAQIDALGQKQRAAQKDVERLTAAEAQVRGDLAAAAQRRDELSAELARTKAERDQARESADKQARSLASRESALAGWDKERGSLTQELARAQAEAAALKAAAKAGQDWTSERERMGRDLAQARQERDAARQDAGQATQQLAAARAELQKTLADTDAIRKGGADHAKVEADLRKELADRKAAADQLESTAHAAQDEAASRTRMHESLLENHRALQKRLAEVSRQLDDAQAAQHTTQQTLEQLEAETASLRKGDSSKVAEMKAALEKSGLDLAREQKRSAALAETVDQRGRDLAAAERVADQLKAAQAEIAKLKDEKRVQKLEQLVADLRTQLKAAGDELEKATETIARQESKLKSYQNR